MYLQYNLFLVSVKILIFCLAGLVSSTYHPGVWGQTGVCAWPRLGAWLCLLWWACLDSDVKSSQVASPATAASRRKRKKKKRSKRYCFHIEFTAMQCTSTKFSAIPRPAEPQPDGSLYPAFYLSVVQTRSQTPTDTHTRTHAQTFCVLTFEVGVHHALDAGSRQRGGPQRVVTATQTMTMALCSRRAAGGTG